MIYFKILEQFLLKILFTKDEYNISSKNFNPIRFFTILLLVSNVFFTVYLLSKISNIYSVVEAKCPGVLAPKHQENKSPPVPVNKMTEEYYN